MPGTNIQTDYEQMADIQRRWSAEADRTRSAIQKLSGSMDQLKGGDWYGDAATKFYNEMDNIVMPALRRLEKALQEAASTTKKVSEAMRAAEADCSGVLNGTGV